MPRRTWRKGNTHTHTLYSDGDSPPEVVVDWYAEHGYDFLFLTDHNTLIPEEHLQRLQTRGLPTWQGEEITMAAVHVNGLGTHELIAPPPPMSWEDEALSETTPTERVRWAARLVDAQGGVASVNHPTTWGALGLPELLEAGDLPLLEVANMHPSSLAANHGDADHPGTEAVWDGLLAAGRRVWGVASDDAHHFKEWGSEYANPGRGWVMVEAAAPDMDQCVRALREGRFYASTGLELADYEATSSEIVVQLATGTAQVELVGARGQVLDATQSATARFALKSFVSPYVRLRARDRQGAMLWTQPFFRDG